MRRMWLAGRREICQRNSPALSTDAAETAQNPLAMIRNAMADDVSALVEIENRAFTSDRISRRSFRYLMSKANAATLVAVENGGAPCGYAIVLFNRGTSLARLYSIAVDPDRQGQGIGGALLLAAETVARQHAAAYMRLEVRDDAEEVNRFTARTAFENSACNRTTTKTMWPPCAWRNRWLRRPTRALCACRITRRLWISPADLRR